MATGLPAKKFWEMLRRFSGRLANCPPSSTQIPAPVWLWKVLPLRVTTQSNSLGGRSVARRNCTPEAPLQSREWWTSTVALPSNRTPGPPVGPSIRQLSISTDWLPAAGWLALPLGLAVNSTPALAVVEAIRLFLIVTGRPLSPEQSCRASGADRALSISTLSSTRPGHAPPSRTAWSARPAASNVIPVTSNPSVFARDRR